MNQIEIEEYEHQLQFEAETHPRFQIGDIVEVYAESDPMWYVGHGVVTRVAWNISRYQHGYDVKLMDTGATEYLRSVDLEPAGTVRTKIAPFTVIEGGKP